MPDLAVLLRDRRPDIDALESRDSGKLSNDDLPNARANLAAECTVLVRPDLLPGKVVAVVIRTDAIYCLAAVSAGSSAAKNRREAACAF